MDPIYVCGHRNPDTDSVVSAMAFAALHNALGDNAYVAAMQGAPNDETQFLLDRFGFQAPTLLTNVRTQVRDIDYDRPPTLGTSVPISHAWAVLREDENLSAVPVTNEDGTLYGMLTAGGIAEKDMESITKPEVRDVPIFNLLSALEGHIINNEEDTFAGRTDHPENRQQRQHRHLRAAEGRGGQGAGNRRIVRHYLPRLTVGKVPRSVQQDVHYRHALRRLPRGADDLSGDSCAAHCPAYGGRAVSPQ